MGLWRCGRRAAIARMRVTTGAVAVSFAVQALVPPPVVAANAATPARHAVVSTPVVLANASATTWNAAVEPDVVLAKDVASFVTPHLNILARFGDDLWDGVNVRQIQRAVDHVHHDGGGGAARNVGVVAVTWQLHALAFTAAISATLVLAYSVAAAGDTVVLVSVVHARAGAAAASAAVKPHAVAANDVTVHIALKFVSIQASRIDARRRAGLVPLLRTQRPRCGGAGVTSAWFD